MADAIAPSMARLLDRLARNLPAKRIGVAVSGGADSVALLLLLKRVAADHPLELVVFHVDHGLRPESRADARWVERLARRLGVPCLMRRLPNPPVAPGAHGGLEAWARRERLRALADLARQAGVEWIALGHHADDQAETILWRILRGTSLSGLGGMRSRQRLTVDGRPLRLWRPLLTWARAELRRWLSELGQDWREDRTNQLPCFERNRLRHEVLPVLEAIRPGVARRLVALGQDAREALRALAATTRQEGRDPDRHGTIFSLAGPLPPSFVLAEQLRRWVIRLGEGERLSRALLQRLVDLARCPRSGRRLPLGHRVIVRTATGLEVLAPAPPSEAGGVLRHLVRGQPVELNGFRYHLTRRRPSSTWEGCWIPRAVAEAGLVLRSRRPGDRFRPAGGAGSKKLSRWLIDRKVPAHQRDGLVLVTTTSGDILWIPGWGRSAATRDHPDEDHVFVGRVAVGPRERSPERIASPEAEARDPLAMSAKKIRTRGRSSRRS